MDRTCLIINSIRATHLATCCIIIIAIISGQQQCTSKLMRKHKKNRNYILHYISTYHNNHLFKPTTQYFHYWY